MEGEMRFDKLPEAAVREEDDPAIQRAIERLLVEGIDVRRPRHPSQLKVARHVSYYPTTGKIFVDGETAARKETGLQALLDLLRDELC